MYLAQIDSTSRLLRMVVPVLVFSFLAATAKSDYITIGTPNGGSRDPLFDTGTRRLQQIYTSAAFGNSPVLITQIAYRSNSSADLDLNLADVQIELSTTSVSPLAMDNNLASNIGADRTVVFDRGTAPFSVTAKESDFDVLLTFSTPFLYDPGAGNLLIDLFVYSGSSTFMFAGTVDDSLGDTNARMADGVGDFAHRGPTLHSRFTVASVSAVPEPSSVAMAGLGLPGGLGLAARRRSGRRDGSPRLR
jgi:hypothetical protein